MSYFLVIKDGVAYYNDTLFKPNAIPYKVPIKALVTPWGFIIPMCYETFNILDYFSGSKEKLDAFSLIISREGDVYEYARDSTSDWMIRRRIPIDKESIFIRSMNRDHDALLTGMIYGGMEVETAIKRLAKERSDFSLHGYRKRSLSAIKTALEVVNAIPYPPLL